MTNVRFLQRTPSSPASPSATADRERCVKPCRESLRAEFRLIGMIITLATLLVTSTTNAQDGMHTYGRTPIGSAPSGAAGGTIVDSNRQGLGFAVRGGHVAGDTVGRNQSASLFQLSPYVNIGNGLLFGDSRLTYANDGGVAWSFGGGYRHYVTAWDAVVGLNSYYDEDKITGADFKQLGFGAEILANAWEARANWYEPYGDTSAQTATRIDPGSAVFEGNRVLFDRINTFAEALQGFDAEIGWLIPGKWDEHVELRAFGGGYAYQGEGTPRFGGFSTRIQADIADWLELGLKLTDDEVFETNLSFSAIVHFGGFRSDEHTSRSAMQRMAEPVRRNLNIASTVSDVTVGREIARAADGTELTIIHVNSNAAAGGTGTVENPFNSLATGLGTAGSDVVFVHAGSMFNAPPDNLVVLNDDQSLFGEGRITDPSGNRNVVNIVNLQDIGDLILPDSPTFASNMTLARPTLSNSAGPAVTMGNRSRFGGFIIDSSAGDGIFASAKSDIVIRDTLISNAAGDGIVLNNVLNTATITDTVISNATGVGFHVNGGNAQIGYSSTSLGIDPAYGAIVNSSNEAVLIENTTGGTVNMRGSTIDDDGGTGIVIRDSAGGAVIDNATILNSSSTGISITNSSGNYFFSDTIRDATTIENATLASVFVDGLAEAGRVSFENLDIITPQGGGIDINNLAGQFTFTQDLRIGAAFAGSTSPFISVDGSTATGVVNFSGDIAINGAAVPATSGGRGIELINSAAGARFTASGQTNIVAVGAEGLAVENDNSTITFGGTTVGGLTVQEVGLNGIRLLNANGAVIFNNGTNVIKTTNAGGLVDVPLVDIRMSQGPVQFDSLQVQASTGDTAIYLEDNIAGADGPGSIFIETLGVITTGGTGLQGINNTLIRTTTGNIDATGAPAVDIVNSGINIVLESVRSVNSPTWGIRLTETNKDLTNSTIIAKTFTVQGDAILNPTALSGGQILAATLEGVLLENAGQVSLRAMEIRDNLYGIRADNSGITTEDNQYLQVYSDSILENDVRGIEAVNVTEVDIRDSLFDDNGDGIATIGPDARRETIALFYTEVPNDPDTTLFADYDNPYLVNIQTSQFIDNSDDVITIENTPAAIGAHIGVNVQNNTFTLNDTNDFDVTDLNEAAFELRWDGPALVNLESNSFELAGANGAESQTAMFIRTTSTEDLLELEIVGNLIDNSSQPGAFGIDMTTAGPSSSLINNNAFNFSGLDSQGMRFNLGSNTRMDLTNNLLRFEAEGGFGIEVERLTQPATFQISGNVIQLSDVIGNFGIPNDGPLEEGIFFRTASGAYTIFGAQNNIIEMITFGDVDRFATFNGNVNGQILVNGNLGP